MEQEPLKASGNTEPGIFDRVFHGFGQAKFPDGGLVLGSSQFSLLPQLPQKNNAQFKRGQNQLKK